MLKSTDNQGRKDFDADNVERLKIDVRRKLVGPHNSSSTRIDFKAGTVEPINVLTELPETALKFLTEAINISILTGLFPSCSKKAPIRPLFGKSDRDLSQTTDQLVCYQPSQESSRNWSNLE